MGEFQAMHKYFAVFLALVACHDSLLSHGRQIKPLNPHSSLNTDTAVQEDIPQPTLVVAPLKTSANVSTPSAEQKVDSPIMPKYDVAGFGDSGVVYANAFRPTTPGSSPGVGHRKFGEDKDMKSMVVIQSPDVKVSDETEGFKNDFRPTDPDHSPGIGHAHQNINGQLT